MATIEISDNELIANLNLMDVVLACHRSVRVPLRSVVGVRARPEEADFDRSVVDYSEGTGLFYQGKLAIGSVRLADGESFFAVRHPEKTVAVDLDDSQDFRHLVLELDDESPEHASARVEAALATYRKNSSWEVGEPDSNDLNLDDRAPWDSVRDLDD